MPNRKPAPDARLAGNRSGPVMPGRSGVVETDQQRYERLRREMLEAFDKRIANKPKPRPDYRAVEDLRHADSAHKPFKTKSGGTADIRWSSPRPPLPGEKMPQAVYRYFRDARNALVCVRRRIRRAVLFSLRRTGKGGARNRRAQWSEQSEIRCKK